MGENKKRKLLMITYGGYNHASSRIRAANYIDFLEQIDNWCVCWMPRAGDVKPGLFNKLRFALQKRLLSIKRFFFIVFFHWDVIFVQRHFLSREIIKIIKWRRIPIVFDFDDAIYLGSEKNAIGTKRMARSARQVIVSNKELEKYCHNHGAMQTNCIISPVDTHRIKCKKIDSKEAFKITIGWIGSQWTEKYLKPIIPVLNQLDSNKVEVLLVGASDSIKIENLNMVAVPWDSEEEHIYLNKMDIGIMPLPDDEWSRGKGGYKLFQYMAAGIPIIASPVGINKDIVKDGGNGFFAVEKEEWLYYFNLLINNSELRKELGETGRGDVEKYYSYNANNIKLQEVLKKAYKQ